MLNKKGVINMKQENRIQELKSEIELLLDQKKSLQLIKKGMSDTMNDLSDGIKKYTKQIVIIINKIEILEKQITKE